MSETKVGYARVSSVGQSFEVQEDKLRAAGCDRIFVEKKSGKQASNRPQLQACLSFVREGDTLMVSRLDRMARSVLDLAKIADLLKQKKVALRVLDQHIDTSKAEGRMMFGILSTFAEFENDIRAERQADGIAKAKANGVKFGRSPALEESQRRRIVTLWKEEEFSAQQLAERFNVGIATIYRTLQSAIPASNC